jgi:Protein of unknown function (DUF2975)
MSVSASQVRKIMRASVWARNITSCLIAFALVGVTFMCVLVAMGGTPGQRIFIGSYIFSQAAIEPWSARVYVMLFAVIAGAMVIASLFLIRAVFEDLARGNIFCEANVRRIRNLGWLAIAVGICALLLPFMNATYFMLTGHAGITFRSEPPFFSGLGHIVSGGLYLLLSWIMAVGLGVREDAEELRRDAELVI